jgi:hypothetical protein
VGIVKGANYSLTAAITKIFCCFFVQVNVTAGSARRRVKSD